MRAWPEDLDVGVGGGGGGDGGSDEDSDSYVPGDTASHDLAAADPEAWQDWWSEELVTLWHSVRDACARNGWAILDACAFSDFADFCARKSSGRANV